MSERAIDWQAVAENFRRQVNEARAELLVIQERQRSIERAALTLAELVANRERVS